MAINKLEDPRFRKQVLEMVYSGSKPLDIAEALGLTFEDIKTIVKSDDGVEELVGNDEALTGMELYAEEKAKSREKLGKLRAELKNGGKKILFSDLLDDEDKAELILELKGIATSEMASMAHKLKAIEQLTKLAETQADQGIGVANQAPVVIFQQFNEAVKIAQEEASQYLQIPAGRDFRTKHLELVVA